jgi:uncharacterized glyoxalase superfamily protein PhnB
MSVTDARISPVFRYQDAHGAMDWLTRAYGFTRHEVFEGPDHSIVHAELRLGPGALVLSSAGAAIGQNPWSTVRCGLYLCTAAVDAIHDRARAAGADIVQPINDTSYGAREFSLRDPGGHLWSFGTYGVSSPDEPSNVRIGLHYQDGPAALEWLERTLGFERFQVFPGKDGVIEHAELGLGQGLIMMSSARYSVGDEGVDKQVSYVSVDDPDAHCAHARATGATILREPHDTPFGARDYYTRDLEGFLWGFSTYAPVNSQFTSTK